MMWTLLLIAGIVIFFVVKFKKKQLPMFTECIRLYTGAPGQGKSQNGVKHVVAAYFKQEKHHKFYCKFPKWLKWFPKLIYKDCEYPAHLLSNCPILLHEEGHGKKKEKIFCETLTKEHLIFHERIPKKAVIFIDEAGSFMSQFDFDNPYIREQVSFLFRFYRHMIDGMIVLADQSSGRIVKPIREVIGKYYYLYDWHKVWGFLPIADISVTPMLMAEDTATRVNTEYGEFHIYAWLWGKKRYDSKHCSELYEKPPKRSVERFTSFKTDYMLDLTVSKKVQKDFVENRDKYHNWLYEERPFVRREREKAESAKAEEMLKNL